MTSEATQSSKAPAAGSDALPTFGEAFRVWLKIGCLSFGGPAGQIAMMHRVLVDDWSAGSVGQQARWSECVELRSANEAAGPIAEP